MYLEFKPDPSDTVLMDIANEIGMEWEQLATYLNFTTAEIGRLKMDHPHSAQTRIFNMLTQWRDRQGQNVNKRQVLREALRDVGLQIVADNHLWWRISKCPPPPTFVTGQIREVTQGLPTMHFFGFTLLWGSPHGTLDPNLMRIRDLDSKTTLPSYGLDLDPSCVLCCVTVRVTECVSSSPAVQFG